MQATIMHPMGPTAQASAEQIADVIPPSARQSATARLNVYHNAYYARLIDCLRTILPATAELLGEEAFAALAGAYLVQNPSTSYTLARLADRLLEFLESTKQQDVREQLSAPTWNDFLRDLIRLELAIDEVFDGPGGEDAVPWDAASLSQISPREALELALQLDPSVRLLTFSFPLNDYYTSFRQGESPVLPPPERTYLALYRRNYVVRRYPLAAPEYHLLAAVSTGMSLGEALASAGAEFEGDPEELATAVFVGLRDAVAAGLITRTTHQDANGA
jgi:hypothetical protein